MKGQACSWRDMRRIKHILEHADRLKGELAALQRCNARTTQLDWQRAIEVMDVVDMSVNRHVQPSHAVQIAQAFPKQPQEWPQWVDACEAGNRRDRVQLHALPSQEVGPVRRRRPSRRLLKQ